MGRRCVLAGAACGTYDQSQRNVSLFRFPKDPSKRKEWLKICGMDEARLPKEPWLCSLHFTEKDVYFRGRAHSLKPGAVPKVYSKENVMLIPQKPPPLILMQKAKVAGNHCILKGTSKQATKLKSKSNVQALISKRQLHRSLKIPTSASPPPLALLDGKEIPPSVLESLEHVKESRKVVFHYLSRLSVQSQQYEASLHCTNSPPRIAPEKQIERLMKNLGAATDEKIRLQMENARLKAELREVKKDLRNVIENEARLRSKVECTLRRCDEKVKEICRLKAQVRRMHMLADVDFDLGRWGKKHLGNVMSVIEIA